MAIASDEGTDQITGVVRATRVPDLPESAPAGDALAVID
jgi:hypothetical protein